MFLLQASSQTWFGVRSVNKLTTCVVVYEIMLVSISDLPTTCLIIMDKLMYVIPTGNQLCMVFSVMSVSYL